jgi:hypothetical protein
MFQCAGLTRTFSSLYSIALDQADKMNLKDIVDGMPERQTQGLAPQATAPNPTPSQAPAAPARIDAPTQGAADAAQDRTHDHKMWESSFGDLTTPQTSSVPQSPDSQTLTSSRKEFLRNHTPQENESSPISHDKIASAIEHIQEAISAASELSANETGFLVEQNLDLVQRVSSLAGALKSVRRSLCSPKKRKSSDPDFVPSEDGSELPPGSPTKTSKKGNFRGGSGFSASQNSNSGDKGTTKGFGYFRKLCGLEEEEKAAALDIAIDKTAFALYTAIRGDDFCTNVRKYADENARSRKNNMPDLVARGVSIDNKNDRRTATKELVRNIQAYQCSEEYLPVFYEMWDNLTLVELVEPYWKDYCSETNKANVPFVRWASNAGGGWQKTWNSKVRDDDMPRMKEEATLAWEHKLKRGWYWQKWCKSVSDNQSSINHRGVLLLFLAAAVSEKLKDGQLERQLNRAQIYIPEAHHWISEYAEILNPIALRMYQNGLDEQDLQQLEGSLRKIKGEMGWDA